MPVSPLDGPPFRGRRATALTRIVGTVRSVLDPDSVEMEYLFEPSGQRFRWRAFGTFERNFHGYYFQLKTLSLLAPTFDFIVLSIRPSGPADQTIIFPEN